MFGSSDCPLSVKLAQFTGTECWYKHWTQRILFTDGVDYLQREAKCHWLIDAIASHQSPALDRACDGFQLWILRKNDKKGAILTCQADCDKPALVAQEIEYTDFPCDEITLYVEGIGARKTVLLPSEH